MSLESCIEKMEEDADKYLVDPEKDFNPELFKTGNKLQKMIKENSERWHCKVRIRFERDIFIWYLNDFYRVLRFLCDLFS